MSFECSIASEHVKKIAWKLLIGSPATNDFLHSWQRHLVENKWKSTWKIREKFSNIQLNKKNNLKVYSYFWYIYVYWHFYMYVLICGILILISGSASMQNFFSMTIQRSASSGLKHRIIDCYLWANFCSHVYLITNTTHKLELFN